MKHIPILFAFLILLSCTTSNMPDKDITFYEVNGKVNHLTIRHYHAKMEDGKIVKSDANTDGEMDQTITFDKNGYISQIYFYGEADSLDLKLVREYNDNHLCVSEKRFDADGHMLSNWVWLYDDNNNNTERIKVLNNGAMVTSLRLHYDDENNLISQKSFPNPQSGYYDSTYWVLDDQDRQIEEYSYNYYGKYDTKKVEYKGKGEQPVKAHIFNINDELSYMLNISYNDHDLVSHIEQLGPDSSLMTVVTFDYNYDARGNWISKTILYNDEPKSIEERNILYY